MKTFHIIIYIWVLFFVPVTSVAQTGKLKSQRSIYPKGYSFWMQFPEGYEETAEHTPLIIFLHGASLCGGSMNRAIKYGPVDAAKHGLPIHAIILAPHNPGGPWSPMKINDILEWMKTKYPFNHDRVYVIGMSLGGYGTIDFAAAYPEKVAAAMALCGGATTKDFESLGKLPLWIIHGTADRAVAVKESQVIVEAMQHSHADTRLRYDWLRGASHGALARYFYVTQTYDWLMSHTLRDPERPVDRTINITQGDLNQAYRDMKDEDFDE